MRIVRLLPLAIVVLGSIPVLAQSTQYTAPGSLGVLPESRRDAITAAAEKARWHLGRLRLEPYVGLRELAWIDEAGLADGAAGSGGDLTATAGVGLRAYLPFGGRSIWAAYALPEYTWWQDRAEFRRWNGRYGVGLFSEFNRLRLDLSAERGEAQGVVTSELERLVSSRSDRLAVEAAFELGRRLALTAAATSGSFVALGKGAASTTFSALDRRDDEWRAGVSYRAGELSAGIGWLESRSAFDATARDRSNRGRGAFVDLGYAGPKLGLALGVKRQELEPDAGSEMPAISATTGRLQLSFNPRRRFGVTLYAGRDLVYSLATTTAFFFDERFGASLGLSLGRRSQLRVFAESGRQDFGATAGLEGASRVDDYVAAGVTASLLLRRGLSLELAAVRTKYDALDPSFDRERTALRIGLGLSGSGTWY